MSIAIEPTDEIPDERRAVAREQLFREALPRVRAAAKDWRNALGALMVALMGFSLIKGRSDLDQLAEGWAVAVGVLLLAALAVGVSAAILLIRAVSGNPFTSMIAAEDLRSPEDLDHLEARRVYRAFLRGLRLTVACAALLATAVGLTWYGPERKPPVLQVTVGTGTVCGTPVSTSGGTVILQTAAGRVRIDLAQSTGIRPLRRCPS